jgi:hydrogenase/urease accessory protein HupE
VFATYLLLGVEHILLGFDHLLFVLGLVLLIRRPRAVVVTVTAFTLAHSLTLAATTLGLVMVARKPVEVCIALSIVFLAREIVRQRESLARRLPALVALVFGLLHGFGFAAALAEIGLPEGEIPPALLAFNLGVEAGQLLVVAGAMAVLALVARLRAPLLPPLRLAAGYALGVVASAWLIERTLA